MQNPTIDPIVVKYAVVSYSHEQGRMLYWQDTNVWGSDSRSARQTLHGALNDYQRMRKVLADDPTLGIIDADALVKVASLGNAARDEYLKRESYESIPMPRRDDARAEGLRAAARRYAEDAVFAAGWGNESLALAALNAGQRPPDPTRLLILQARTDRLDHSRGVDAVVDRLTMTSGVDHESRSALTKARAAFGVIANNSVERVIQEHAKEHFAKLDLAMIDRLTTNQRNLCTVQEVWDAVGGNVDWKPTRGELFDALDAIREDRKESAKRLRASNDENGPGP